MHPLSAGLNGHTSSRGSITAQRQYPYGTRLPNHTSKARVQNRTLGEKVVPIRPVVRQKKNAAGKNTAAKKLAAAAPAIRRQFGVTRLGLFGSFARGEQTRTSDVDVLVGFAPGSATLHNFICLSDYLEQLFKRKVDLLTEASLSDLIRPYIERDVIWIEG